MLAAVRHRRTKEGFRKGNRTCARHGGSLAVLDEADGPAVEKDPSEERDWPTGH